MPACWPTPAPLGRGWRGSRWPGLAEFAYAPAIASFVRAEARENARRWRVRPAGWAERCGYTAPMSVHAQETVGPVRIETEHRMPGAEGDLPSVPVVFLKPLRKHFEPYAERFGRRTTPDPAQ